MARQVLFGFLLFGFLLLGDVKKVAKGGFGLAPAVGAIDRLGIGLHRSTAS